MAPVDHDIPAEIPGTGSDARGIDRRGLIRRAAIVGAAAWTAPVIIGSLASPAGALTISGCYRAQFDDTSAGSTTSCRSFVQLAPQDVDNGAGCLEPNVWNNRAVFPDTITLAVGGSFPNCTYTLTLPADSDCVWDTRSAARADQGNKCASPALGQGTISPDGKTLFIDPDPNLLPDRFKLLIVCDGIACV